MKSCRSNSSKQEWTKFVLKEVERTAVDDIYAARSWILTAKQLLPGSFSLLLQAYKVEFNGGNGEQCGTLLSEMFQQHPNEPLLWMEFKSFLLPTTGQETTSLMILSYVARDVQLDMLKFFADQQTDMHVRCDLSLLLMQKSPDSISQIGMPLAEKLVEVEKEFSPGTALNGYRKRLVCDLLPVICKNVTGISHKHFYKWLQKAIEFYVAYFCASPAAVSELIGDAILSWEDLRILLHHISVQCDWSLETGLKSSIQERMNHICDLHRRSKTDLTGSINKKQIFYSSILLLMEGAMNYSKLLDPHFYQIDVLAYEESNAISCDWSLKAIKLESTCTLGNDLAKFFDVAKTSWLILVSSEIFRKDLNHLYKRWKMEKWTWFQFFLVNNFVSEKSYESAIAKLLDILKWNGSDSYVARHCICQLAPLYTITNQSHLACKYALKLCANSCETILKEGRTPKLYNMSSFGPDQILFSLTPENMLQLMVDIVTRSINNMKNIYADDRRCGHLLVLSQHNWPQRKNDCLQVMEVLSKKSNFTYSIFFDYVIIADILEEIALLGNVGNCELLLLPSARNSLQRVTRYTGKNESEEFMNVLKQQISKDEDLCHGLLVKFFLEQKDSIMDCLQLRPQLNSSEPTMVDNW